MKISNFTLVFFLCFSFSLKLYSQSDEVKNKYYRITNAAKEFEVDLNAFPPSPSKTTARAISDSASSLYVAVNSLLSTLEYEANKSANSAELRKAYQDFRSKIQLIDLDKLVDLADLLVDANCFTNVKLCNFIFRHKDVIREYNKTYINGINNAQQAYSVVKREFENDRLDRMSRQTNTNQKQTGQKNANNDWDEFDEFEDVDNTSKKNSSNNLINGKSITMRYSNGRKYIGEFKNNQRSGTGKLYDADGKIIYEGEWLNDKKNGKGKDYFKSGDVYEGEFKNGSKHGQGVYKKTNGIKYVGQFQNDQFNGYGSIFFTDNAKYEGGFKNNRAHESGTYTNKYGILFNGNWRNGALYGKKFDYFDQIKTNNSRFLSFLNFIADFNYSENRFNFQIIDFNKAAPTFEELDYANLKFNSQGYIDIPFVVNKDLSPNSNFMVIILNSSTWSVLDSNKKPIVKNYLNLNDENNNTIGIIQSNNNLSTPITQKGTYYIRLFNKSGDLSEHLSLFFVGEALNAK